jgi:hypothetical protein
MDIALIGFRSFMFLSPSKPHVSAAFDISTRSPCFIELIKSVSWNSAGLFIINTLLQQPLVYKRELNREPLHKEPL